MKTHFRKYLITGLLVILPFFLTIYILIGLFKFADGILGRIINNYLVQFVGFYIPGLGLILSLLILLTVGYLTVHFLGKGFYAMLERWFTKFPLARYIYPSIKQIVEFFFSKESIAFQRVVLVEYPRKGIWSIGFMTNEGIEEAKKKISEDLINVFIPTTPSPLTGYFILVPRKDAMFLDMSIEDAIKVVISGGLLTPLFSGPKHQNT